MNEIYILIGAVMYVSALISLDEFLVNYGDGRLYRQGIIRFVFLGTYGVVIMWIIYIAMLLGLIKVEE